MGAMGVLAPTDLHNKYIFVLKVLSICLLAPMVEVMFVLIGGSGSILLAVIMQIFCSASSLLPSATFLPPTLKSYLRP